MQTMNFIVTEMTFLRYFMPLIEEGNRRGIRSRLFAFSNIKYNNPYSHRKVLKQLARDYDFDLYFSPEKLRRAKGLVFTIEGCGRSHVQEGKTIVLTYQSDFRVSYKKYIRDVRHVIFPGKSFAKFYNCSSPKNLYLGSPKYDVKLDRETILKKYKLEDRKYATFIFPKTKNRASSSFNHVAEFLGDLGYTTLLKTRGKDPFDKKTKGIRFTDNSWYPHTTMELLYVSDLMINSCSTTIKEAILLRKPSINLVVKSYKRLEYLYKYPFTVDVKPGKDKGQFIEAHKQLFEQDLETAFDECTRENFVTGNSSKRILETLT